jgi:LytS/YehU family sensor histidine kinase
MYIRSIEQELERRIQMKRIIKKALPYIIAIIVGIVVMLIVTPIAKANREVPSLVGGEMCIPVIAVVGTFIVRSIYNDIKSDMFNTEDDEQ